MNKSNKLRLCVVTYPLPMASIMPLSNLVDILSKLSNSIFLLTGNEGGRVLESHPLIKGISIAYRSSSNIFLRILGHAALQLNVTFKILRTNKEVDAFIFFFGHGLVLPLIACKLTGKKVMLDLAGSLIKIMEQDRRPLSGVFTFLEKLNYQLADNIIIYSPTLVEEWELGKFKQKIRVAHEHFMNFSEFRISNSYKNRKFTVGFAGRFSEEKGALNFVKAIPAILKEDNRIDFVIAGDGHLKPEMESYLKENNLTEKCKLVGWLSHSDLPVFFNRLKLLVIPSYTEGLPNIMLESMACGTPVLAAPVGAIPDYIRDGETGFLLKDSSPASISEGVLRALVNSSIEEISANGYIVVEKNFTFEATVRNFEGILNYSVDRN